MITTLFILVAILGTPVFFLRCRQPAPALHGEQLSIPLATDRTDSCFTLGLYNIHRACGTDGQRDLARIARVIANADVIGLCECEGPSITGDADQCTQLGRQLQLGALFSPTQKRWGRYDRGNGLLTRLPVTRWYQEPLIDSTGTHARCLLRADLQIGSDSVPLFITHLARRIDQAIQLETVIARFAQYERAILIGDFNLTRENPQLKTFVEDNNHMDALAISSFTDDSKRIDWIISKGFDVIEGGYTPVGPSDHPYYWVKLAI